MRLGILGPAQGDLAALARAAQHLLDHAHAERVLYLAEDDALDQVVGAWAAAIVGAGADRASVFERAAERCTSADAPTIDDFVEGERARQRLAVLVSLPPGSRTIEILDGRVVVFVYDKAVLDEEDIAAAALLVFGKSPEAVIKRVGTRVFLAPGPLASPKGGCAILDDEGGGVRITLMTVEGKILAEGSIGAPHTAKVKVQRG